MKKNISVLNFCYQTEARADQQQLQKNIQQILLRLHRCFPKTSSTDDPPREPALRSPVHPVSFDDAMAESSREKPEPKAQRGGGANRQIWGRGRWGRWAVCLVLSGIFLLYVNFLTFSMIFRIKIIKSIKQINLESLVMNWLWLIISRLLII